MRFENTDELKGAEFVDVDLTDARFQNVNLTGARLREALLVNARFSGLIEGLVVNNVEVAPLIHFGIDPTADPPSDEVIAVREGRMAVVGDLIVDLADRDLQRECGDHTVLTCLWTLFEEEWAHNWYAQRDLDVLTGSER